MNPFSINIGTDIVHIPRITRLLHRRPSNLYKFTHRILSESERADLQTRFRIQIPIDANTSTKNFDSNSNANDPNKAPLLSLDISRWIAGRFAAKEAARKAAPSVLGAASLGWKDVIVRIPKLDIHNRGDDDVFSVGTMTGKPEIVYLGPTQKQKQGYCTGSGRSGELDNIIPVTSATNANANGDANADTCPERVGKLSISHDGEYVVATVLAIG